jgi:hypothetical protein
MEALTCWLSDERRGVTYAWAARELCISSAAAIQLLEEYARSAPPKALLAHYLVCGTAAPARAADGTHSDALPAPHVVSVVSGDDLEGAETA